MATRREEVDVRVTGADAGARDLGRLGESAEDVADAFGEIGQRVNRLAAQMRVGERSAASIDAELKDLAADALAAAGNLRGTAAGLDDVGDEAGRAARKVDELGDELSGLTSKRVAGAVAGAGAEVVGIGARISGAITTATGAAFTAAASNPYVLAAVTTAGTVLALALAAPIGATIAAAIGLAFGGGALAAGIVAASKSPAVVAAFKPLVDQAKTAFAEFGEHFVTGLFRTLVAAQVALAAMRPHLDAIGKALGPVLEKLGPAMVDLATHAMPGIAAAAIASKPLFDVLAAHGPQIGDSISRFADAMARAAPAASVMLDDLLNLIEIALPALGTLLVGLSRIWAINSAGAKNVAKALEPIVEVLRDAIRLADELLRKLGLTSKGKAKTISSGAGGKVQFLAEGGPLAAGEPAIVGERGPELFIPSVSGMVRPNGSGVHGAISRGSTEVTFGGDVDSWFARTFMHLQRTGQIQIYGT